MMMVVITTMPGSVPMTKITLTLVSSTNTELEIEIGQPFIKSRNIFIDYH